MLEKVEHPHIIEIEVDDDQPEELLAKRTLRVFERAHEGGPAVREALERDRSSTSLAAIRILSGAQATVMRGRFRKSTCRFSRRSR